MLKIKVKIFVNTSDCILSIPASKSTINFSFGLATGSGSRNSSGGSRRDTGGGPTGGVDINANCCFSACSSIFFVCSSFLSVIGFVALL